MDPEAETNQQRLTSYSLQSRSTSYGTSLTSQLTGRTRFQPGDLIELKEQLNSNDWKVEVNGLPCERAIRFRFLHRTSSQMGIELAENLELSGSAPRERRSTRSRGSGHIPISKMDPVDFQQKSRHSEEMPIIHGNLKTLEPWNPPSATATPTATIADSKGLDSAMSFNLDQQSNECLSYDFRASGADPAFCQTMISSELRRARLDLYAAMVDTRLMVLAADQNGVKLKHPPWLMSESPEQRMLNRMLQLPFQSMFKLKDGGVLNKEREHDTDDAERQFVMAPARPLRYDEMLTFILNPNAISDEVRASLNTLEFDVFPIKDANDESMACLMLLNMFHSLNLVNLFRIPEATLCRFLLSVVRRYRAIPFHNFFHAFNVVQTMYYFIVYCQAERLLTKLDELILLVASLCHDCDHPGYNNDFQRKAQTRIYHLHKKSVLENHHYLTCMSLLMSPETNILVNLTHTQKQHMHVEIRDLILATDLAVHAITLQALNQKRRVLAKHFKAGTGNLMSDENRKLLMIGLIKCADLSNEIRPDAISKRWAKLVIAEFISQSDRERDLQLPVTPFMDRDKIIIAKEQINFIEKLSLPLYTPLAAILPQVESCCRIMALHKRQWLNHLKSFFLKDPNEIKKLSNQSIWERKQAKAMGHSLSTTLAARASNALAPP